MLVWCSSIWTWLLKDRGEGYILNPRHAALLRSRSIATKIGGQLGIGYPRRFWCSTPTCRPIFRPKSSRAQVGQGSKIPNQNYLIQSMPRQSEHYWADQDQIPCSDSASLAVSDSTVISDGRLNQFFHSGSKQFPSEVWKIIILKISKPSVFWR